jgi:hypothetical protein
MLESKRDITDVCNQKGIIFFNFTTRRSHENAEFTRIMPY